MFPLKSKLYKESEFEFIILKKDKPFRFYWNFYKPRNALADCSRFL